MAPADPRLTRQRDRGAGKAKEMGWSSGAMAEERAQASGGRSQKSVEEEQKSVEGGG